MTIPSGSNSSDPFGVPQSPVESEAEIEEEELQEEMNNDALDPASTKYDPSLIQKRGSNSPGGSPTGDTIDQYTQPDDKYTV